MASTLQHLPVLDSNSEPPALFDGTPRLYICLTCPYAQRVWIARNYKGIENIELVAISLADKPKWYLEKVYPVGKVPSLEHNGQVKGESLDLLEYIDKNFEGPRIFPEDPVKQAAAKELLTFTDEFSKQYMAALRDKEATTPEHAKKYLGPVLDNLDAALRRFTEGPFFLGEISAVDFAYAPFLERCHYLSLDLLNYNIFEGRPHLEKWFESLNKLDAYTSTKAPRDAIVNGTKKRMGRL